MDEMEPIAVKSYPGAEWKEGPLRATFEPDYGRHGKLWVQGAFEPATGKAVTLIISMFNLSSIASLLSERTTKRGQNLLDQAMPHDVFGL